MHLTSVVQTSGDPRSPDGSTLALSTEATGPAGSGAITSLDATAFRGREVELSGVLEVTQGAGAAALWLRADGPAGRLAFFSTGGRPVTLQGGSQPRALQLYIPMAATHLKFGVTLQSAGALRARALRLKTLEATPDTGSAYTLLETAISTIRAHALNTGQVDWAAQSRLLTPALKDAPAQEAHVHIDAVLEALGDRHSALLPRRAAADYRADAVATQPIEAHVRDGVGYVRVPGVRGSDRDAGRVFSAALCQAIESHGAAASSGWIVDLRGNGGGAMWPMLAGLRPLLGDVHIGAFKGRAGASSPWTPRPIDTCSADLARSPVAVLIGPRTASSGEAVAIAFKGRVETRFFGQPTAGLATSNQTFPLLDGSVMMLTTSVFVDRAGQAYPDGVPPDVPVEAEQDAIDIAADWLESQR
ncbi:MAG: S41 family peptidase [Luteimonas sp.]